MTKTTVALTALALAFAFSGPASATSLKNVVSASSGAAIIYADDKMKCKEGWMWDKETKKCKKKEG